MGVNENAARRKRFFAISSLGKKRWYWVVWPSLEELQSSKETLLNIGEGYEGSKAIAVERALELAGADAEWIPAKYAKAYYRGKTGVSREPVSSPSASSSTVPETQAYLYRDIRDSETGQWHSPPHRVTRKTSKYVYVQQHPYSSDDGTGTWLDQGRPTYRLDRQALEQDGYAFIPVTAYIADAEDPAFFTLPYHRRKGYGKDEAPDCLETLGLSWPCTAAEIRAAYRILVKQAHPDGGGSHDEFLALQTAYRQALDVCAFE